ncbi:MAG: putative heparinase superfamily protein [Alphaproteobacteria bacterium]|jgi:uncharacterized heparinase superfamily protein
MFKKIQIGAFMRTIRYLKLSQIQARLEYSLRRVYYTSPLHPFLEDKLSTPHNLLVSPPYLWASHKKHGKGIIKNNTFHFINQPIAIGSEMRWHPQGVSSLWLYNLHYFTWLNDLKDLKKEGQDKAQELIESWLLDCNHFDKQIWHPYPLSLRLINWLTHYHWLTENMDQDLKKTFNQSLILQTEHLSHNLEWDVEGNHLIKNLKAMIYCGLCLPSKQTAYLDAITLLLEQINIQINADGGHYEKSPHYHIDVLKDFLDIQALILKAGQTPPARLTEAIDRMAIALEFYLYKDKQLALFNDGCVGDKDEIESILKRCRTGEELPQELPDTGYVRMERKKTLLMMDVGTCCPDNLPAHGHADTLSFEMCHGVERIFVNNGTYAYQHKKRNIFRGTAAHNTVSIAGENSAEVWATFRIGRRPTQVEYTLKSEKNVGIGVDASHNGYRHLKATHNRKVFLSDDGHDIRGEDTITNKGHHRTLAHFHLHPNIKCKIVSQEEAEITTEKGIKLSFIAKGGRLYEAQSEYAPQFGEKTIAKQLVIKGNYRQNTCTLKWAIKII